MGGHQSPAPEKDEWLAPPEILKALGPSLVEHDGGAFHLLGQRAHSSMKRCTKCGMESPANVEHFPPRKAMADGLKSNCRLCERERARERQEKRRHDPILREKLLAEKDRYRRSERGRKRKREQSFIDNHKRRERRQKVPWRWTEEDWRKCKQAWSNRCAYCGAAADLTQDHFIPLSAPNCPGTIPSNMLPVCLRCNTSKQHRSPYIWLKDQQRLERILDYLHSMS